MTFSGGGRRREQNEIAQDVARLTGDQTNLFFIKTDDTLWGLGTNAAGELGDGTRVPRQDTPVKIAANVICAGLYYYLTTSGELWIWRSETPPPKNISTMFLLFYWAEFQSGEDEFLI